MGFKHAILSFVDTSAQGEGGGDRFFAVDSDGAVVEAPRVEVCELEEAMVLDGPLKTEEKGSPSIKQLGVYLWDVRLRLGEEWVLWGLYDAERNQTLVGHGRVRKGA